MPPPPLQQVTFTYHKGLRDDELLVFYGFLLPPRPAAEGARQLLMAVDHPEFRTPASDPEDGDLYSERGGCGGGGRGDRGGKRCGGAGLWVRVRVRVRLRVRVRVGACFDRVEGG